MFFEGRLKVQIAETQNQNSKSKSFFLTFLDCKTRWNSLLDMLERFLKVKDCIQKSSIDVKSALTFFEEEFCQVFIILDGLQPGKIAVESLCERNSNLVTASATMQFLLNKIDGQKTDLRERLKILFETRIQKQELI